jgi:anti-sigma-K factor RskA
MKPENEDPYAIHEAVAALLPWYVNGTLEQDEHHLVERHLAVCLSCRTDVERERRVAGAMRDTETETLAAGNAFAALAERLHRPQAPGRRPHRLPYRRRTRWRLALAAAMLGAAAVLLPRLAAPPPQDSFRTLARPSKAAVTEAGQLRVVFAGDLDERARRALLRQLGGYIVTGPSAAGVYTVAPRPAADVASMLAALRATAQVRFAEPVLAPSRGVTE